VTRLACDITVHIGDDSKFVVYREYVGNDTWVAQLVDDRGSSMVELVGTKQDLRRLFHDAHTQLAATGGDE
jgi:hypothetical protein